MRDRDIAAWRLASQWVTQPGADAKAVVGHLLAVQAENQRQSEWAVAARTVAPRADAVPDLLADGSVIRTHVMRPTWHYALAEDVGWLLDLTGPRLRSSTATGLVRQGFDGAFVARVSDVVCASLAERPDQTRQELRELVAAAGLEIGGMQIAQLLAVAEFDQLICSGVPRDGEHTYALFADRVTAPRRLDPEAALAEIVVRYVSGHGPATVRDLAYWGTLGLTDLRRGLAAAKHQLASFEHDGRTYWHAADSEPPRASGEPRGHLLMALDELHNGFQDTRYALDEAGLVPHATRYPAVGMALVDAQFVAVHTRTVTPSAVRFDLIGWRNLGPDDLKALAEAAERVGSYLGLTSQLRVVPASSDVALDVDRPRPGDRAGSPGDL
ncbi:MAG: winged helix DNA-binding domain-containing protein [Propionibacteriaceae bacterium]